MIHQFIQFSDPLLVENFIFHLHAFKHRLTFISHKYDDICYSSELPPFKSSEDLYFAPFVITSGTVMNLISIAVHRRKAFRSTSVGFILQCLAVTDSLILTFVYSITTSKSWTGEYFFIECDSWSSQCITSLTTVLCFESYLPQVAAWSLVILTLERLVIVVSPVKGRLLMARRRVITAWIVTTVLLAILQVKPVTMLLKCRNLTSTSWPTLYSLNDTLVWISNGTLTRNA
jgi:hypothetical protein